MRHLRLKIPPPLVALVAAAAIWALSRAFPGLHFDLRGRPAIASVLAGLGIAVSAAGIGRFFQVRTTIRPEHPENTTSLVTTGVYRVTRNPMYLGLVLMLSAWAVMKSNAAGFVVIPLFVLFLQEFQIVPEEDALSSKFGNDYAEYRRRVRRWL